MYSDRQHDDGRFVRLDTCALVDSGAMISDYIEGGNCDPVGLYWTVEVDRSILFKENREGRSQSYKGPLHISIISIFPFPARHVVGASMVEKEWPEGPGRWGWKCKMGPFYQRSPKLCAGGCVFKIHG